MNGKLRIAFMPFGDNEIELLQPTDPNTSFGSFLKTHGQGIHHISLVTDNIGSEMSKMEKEGVAFDDLPRIDVHGVRIVFTKPETTGGVTFEIIEER